MLAVWPGCLSLFLWWFFWCPQWLCGFTWTFTLSILCYCGLFTSLFSSHHALCGVAPSTFPQLFMSNNRDIRILVWNVRGINSHNKWDAIRDKISESSASIVCLQETKRDHFDLQYLKKFCPRQLNVFHFSPSVGASGGLIIIWNSNQFSGTLVFMNTYSITVKLTCNLSGHSFHLTNIYGPAHAVEKASFQ